MGFWAIHHSGDNVSLPCLGSLINGAKVPAIGRDSRKGYTVFWRTRAMLRLLSQASSASGAFSRVSGRREGPKQNVPRGGKRVLPRSRGAYPSSPGEVGNVSGRAARGLAALASIERAD